MNVNVAAAICLHRFADWAEFQECPRQGLQFRAQESMPEMHRRFREAGRPPATPTVGDTNPVIQDDAVEPEDPVIQQDAISEQDPISE